MSIDKEKLDRINELHRSLKVEFDTYSDDIKKNTRRDIEGNDTLLSENHFSERSPEEDVHDYNSFRETDIKKVSYHNSSKPSVSLHEDTQIKSRIGLENRINLGDSVRIRESENKYTQKNSSLTQKKDEKISSTDSINVHIGDRNTEESYDRRTLRYEGTYKFNEGNTKFTKNTVEVSASATAVLNQSAYNFYNKMSFSNSANGVDVGMKLGLVEYKMRRVRLSNYTVTVNANNYLASSRIFNLFLTGTVHKTFNKSLTLALYKKGNFLAFMQHKLYGRANCMNEVDESITYQENTRVAVKINMGRISRSLLTKRNGVTLT